MFGQTLSAPSGCLLVRTVAVTSSRRAPQALWPTVFPQAEVRIIERCGHLPMVERTDEFLAAFLPFIDRAEAAVAA